MKICRFNANRLGLIEADEVLDVTAALDVLPSCKYPYPLGDQLIAHLDQVREKIISIKASAKRFPLSKVQLLAPVANPTKIIGAPINYDDHIAESRDDNNIAHGRKISSIHDWGLFLKASSSLIGFGEQIILRHPERRNDHEGELAVIIGKRCDRVSVTEALDYVAAYSIGLDMTARGPEFQCWRKSIDTYSVLGPWMVTADEISNPDDLKLSLSVNGQLRQDGSTKYLIVGVAELIAWASSMYVLHPGDIIMTGTPAGVGPVHPGDLIEASVQNIGKAQVQVANYYD